MNKALKIGLIGGAAITLTLLASKAYDGYRLAQGLTFRLIDFGIPQISNNIVSIPVVVEMNNPTEAVMNVDSVDVTISMVKQNQWVRIGQAHVENITTDSGISRKPFTAQFDLNVITADLFDTLTQIFSEKLITVNADVQLVVEGVQLPVQSFQKAISIV